MTRILFVTASILLFLTTFVLQGQAGLYGTVQTILVISQTSSPLDPEEAIQQEWLITAESKQSETVLACYADHRDHSPYCRVIVTEDGSVKRITGDRVQQNSEPLLLDIGSPAPMDILPVSQKETERVYKMATAAGGRSFSREYRVTVAEIEKSAVKREWLRKSAAGIENFRSISVYNDNNERVAFQLWPAGGKWWLYEETPYRKSWRINIIRN